MGSECHIRSARAAGMRGSGVLALFLGTAMLAAPQIPVGSHAQEAASPLAGRITSVQEGPMEGVLVSAQRAGSPITITVVSGADGHFSFPPGKLASGRYDLRIRAVGYELDGNASAEVAPSK